MQTGSFLFAAIFSFTLFAHLAGATDIPVLHVADTINPGSAAYVVRGIESAEKANAPYVIVELDTPGGLLTSTRQIVQHMLNAKIPVVVYIGPRGAHAGSAGAIITFAADVAAMAPGTHLGSAHPVSGGGEKMDQVMQEKITNDTAAFAESLAKHHGRNTEWAIKAVRDSSSVIADEALKLNVIDLVAEDLGDLTKKLSNYSLRHVKGTVARLAVESPQPVEVKPTLQQRVLSFFADPNLAYLILTLGGLCLWIELSHPGLIFPGVLGAFCLFTSLISFQMLPIRYGALGLLLLGMGMLIAELFLPTYGLLGLGGIGCFLVGSLFLMDTQAPDFQISPKVIYPAAATLAAMILLLGYFVFKARRRRPLSGLEALVGEFGEIKDPIVPPHAGKILVHGELWNAVTENGEPLSEGLVVVTEVRAMLLVVKPQRSR